MRNVLFFCFCMYFLVGCVTDKDFQLLNREVVELGYRQEALKKSYAKEIEELKRQFQKELSTSNFSMRSSQADIASQLESLRLKIANLEGQYDLLQREIEKQTSSDRDIKADIEGIKKNIEEIQRDVESLKSILGVTKNTKKRERKEISGGEKRGIEKEKSEIKPEKYELSPKKLYEQALQNFRERNYYASAHLFSLFIERFPSHKLAPNAYFWRGECYFRLSQYAKAILSYQVVLDKYKLSNKYPAALLKEGIAFYKIGKKKAGSILLKELVQNFPNSKEAKVARGFLKDPKDF